MSDELPEVIDIHDALEEIEANADADVEDELSAIRTDLNDLAERDRDERESVLDDIDGRVLSMRERVDGESERRAESIHNRIETYRNTVREGSETLSLSAAGLHTTEGESIEGGAHTDELAVLSGTMVNGGEARRATVSVEFYDEDAGVLRTVEHHEGELRPDEHREFEYAIYIPDGTGQYAVSALDSEDPRTGGGPDENGTDSAGASGSVE